MCGVWCATNYLCPSVSISRVISEGSTCVALSLSLSLSLSLLTTQSEGLGRLSQVPECREITHSRGKYFRTNIPLKIFHLTTEHRVIMFSSQTHPASHLRLPFSDHQQPFQHLHTAAAAIPGMFYITRLQLLISHFECSNFQTFIRPNQA